MGTPNNVGVQHFHIVRGKELNARGAKAVLEKMAALLYAVIANETSPTPLVEVSLVSGNFNLVCLQLIKTLRPNSSMSYNYENQCFPPRYMFHTLNEDSLSYVCLSDSAFPAQSAYDFLFDLRDKFTSKYGAQSKTAIGLSAKDFAQIVKERMAYFNNPSSDHLQMTRRNIEEAHKVMIENLDKVLSRGQKIELLVDKTALMSDEAVTMRRTVRTRQATKVKQHYWWKNLKMSLLMIAVLLAIGLVVVLVLCGGVRFPDC